MQNLLSRISTALCPIAIFAVLAASGCAGSSEHSVQPSPPTLAQDAPVGATNNWQKLTPGGDTSCSDGSEFSFYARRGDPRKLLFFLQGGGGCWNTQTCDPIGRPSYTVNLDGFDPSQSDGIFNFSRSENPLRNHTVVFVPYCSGDVHLGDAVRTYNRGEDWINHLKNQGVPLQTIKPLFKVHHSGLANAESALDWVTAEVAKPESVLVAGSSAGSIPSPYYAVQLARAYPDATVSQLGDGSGGYRRINQSASPHLAWNTVAALQADTAFAGLNEETFTFEALYIAAYGADSTLRLNAYDTAEDDVQLQFLQLSGLQVQSLHKAIKQNQADIRRQVPSFRSYIASGELHTILRRPEFYEFKVGNRSVRDWVADLVAGKDLENVACLNCQ